jgi:hypothetical protein
VQRSALIIVSLLFALAGPLQAEESDYSGAPLMLAANVAFDATTNMRGKVTQGPVVEAKSAATNDADYDLSYLLVIGLGVVGLLWIRRQAHNL